MLTITDLSMQFGGRTLFKNVNVNFAKGECYGIIGANGAGKSTLLRIISGDLEPTSGHVTLTDNERMSVLKQNQDAFDNETVLRTVLLGHKRLVEVMDQKEALYSKADFTEEDGILAGELENEFAELGGWEAESEAQTMLNNLGVSTEFHDKLMSEIDSKLKVKVLLAQALFGNPDILVLDEPTNNLDALAASWLEDFLADFENTILIVSHDRYFLNKVCTRILDVDYNEVRSYIGNYDFWYESSQLLQRQMKQENAKKEDKIKELQDFIARFSANASKSRQATSRKKLLDKITLDDIKPSSRRYPFVDFKFDTEIGNDVLTVEDATIDGFFKNLSFTLRKTDKVAFIADNSVAVTKLFNALAGEEKFDSGKFKFGITINPVYFSSSLNEFDGIEENLVGVQIPEHPPEGFPDVPLPGQVIQGIQRGNRRIHRLQQPESRHGLPQKKRRPFQIRRFPHSLRQHFLRQIRGRHVITLRRQQTGNGAGAAGQIQYRMHRNGAPAEKFFQKVRPAAVNTVGHQAVIAGGQCIVAAHASGFSSAASSSFMRANTRS